MRLPRLRTHHFVAAGLLAVLVVGSLLIGRPVRGEEATRVHPSSWNDDSSGVLGLYLLADGVGLDVARYTGAMEALDPADVPVLVVAGTAQEEDSLIALEEWVSSGGRLLLATKDERTLGAFGLVAGAAGDSGEPVRPAGRATSWGLAPVLAVPSARFLEIPANAERLLGQGKDRPVAVSVSHGAGVVVALADPDLITNGALADGEAQVLAIRLLEEVAEGGPIRFCETWLGYGGGGTGSGLARILARTPIGHALLGAAAFLALLLFAEAKRFGRIRRDLEPPRRSEYEFLDALGGLLVRSRAWTETGRLLLQGVRRRSERGGARGGPRTAGELAARLSWDRPGEADAIRASVSVLASGSDPGSMAAALRVVDTALPPDPSVPHESVPRDSVPHESIPHAATPHERSLHAPR